MVAWSWQVVAGAPAPVTGVVVVSGGSSWSQPLTRLAAVLLSVTVVTAPLVAPKGATVAVGGVVEGDVVRRSRRDASLDLHDCILVSTCVTRPTALVAAWMAVVTEADEASESRAGGASATGGPPSVVTVAEGGRRLLAAPVATVAWASC